jgi:hypothetical protein
VTKSKNDEGLIDGLTKEEIEEAERIMDPQAAKVNVRYQYRKGLAKEMR